jgi:uncharacterized protein
MRMAKPNEVTESSMEEILASIRKIISEDESKIAGAKPAPTRAEDGSASNVSRLFASNPDEIAGQPLADSMRDALEELQEEAIRHDEAFSPGGHDERQMNAEERAEPVTDDKQSTLPDKMPAAANPGNSLLSPRADAAVASAFSHLASTILSNNSRTVEQLAEEMMRPMLKDWLDENLPPLVERLVREEIERVSRRR